MKMSPILIGFPLLIGMLFCCSTDKISADEQEALADSDIASKEGGAKTTLVEISGEENAYRFNVTVSSPDTGCEQYADWWEVIDTDGNLLFRRILAHSHVGEQPFSRSGGPIAISGNTEVYIRAHMNNLGYGDSVLKGSVEKGFEPIRLDAEFAEALASENPLPEGCAF